MYASNVKAVKMLKKVQASDWYSSITLIKYNKSIFKAAAILEVLLVVPKRKKMKHEIQISSNLSK